MDIGPARLRHHQRGETVILDRGDQAAAQEKIKEMRNRLFEIYSLLKNENQYGMKPVNFSTSITTDTTKHAYNTIFEDMLPVQAKLKTDPQEKHEGHHIRASQSQDAIGHDITLDIDKLSTLIMEDPDISKVLTDQLITEVTLDEIKTDEDVDKIDEYINLKDKLKTISNIKDRGIGSTIEIIDPLIQEFSNFLMRKAENGINLKIISCT